MTCTPSPFPKAVLAEASRISPRRRTSSDGICGDAAHQAQGTASDMFGTAVIPDTAFVPQTITGDKIVSPTLLLQAAGAATYAVNNASYTTFGVGAFSLSVTVPSWSTSAVVQTVLEGAFVVTNTGTFQIRTVLGSVNGKDGAWISDTTGTTNRLFYPYWDHFTGLTAGSTVTISVQGKQISGTGELRMDTHSYVSYWLNFLP